MSVTEQRSTAELVMDVADDLRLLIRKEIELARIELLDGIKAQLIGAGLVLLAALGIIPALLFLVFAGVFWMPFSPEVSFAIVGFALIAVAAIAVLVGIRVMKSRRPKLEKSVASIKEDVRWAREQLTS
ncbi:MAG: phage holin family protein [Actinomycetota bacterium]